MKTELASFERRLIARMAEVSEFIEEAESMIDMKQTIWLFTWSPDPKELPDVDFNLQHETNVNLLADFLKCCHCGVICLEGTQMGNPHYHGWYQPDIKYAQSRHAITKTMLRFGPQMKLTKTKYAVKIFNWEKHHNALYYYKKELMDAYLYAPFNPVTRDSRCDLDCEAIRIASFLTLKKGPDIEERMTSMQYFADFYSDTRSHTG